MITQHGRRSGSKRRVGRVVSGLLGVVVVAGTMLVSPGTASAGSGTASGFADFGKFHCKKVSTGDSSIHTDCKVTDTEKDGHGVYLQVKGIRDYNVDTSWWRHSRNVRPGYPATNHLKDDSYGESDGVDRWQIRVCKEISDVDDPCSGSDTVEG